MSVRLPEAPTMSKPIPDWIRDVGAVASFIAMTVIVAAVVFAIWIR